MPYAALAAAAIARPITTTIATAAVVVAAQQEQDNQNQNPGAAVAAEKTVTTHTHFPPFASLLSYYGRMKKWFLVHAFLQAVEVYPAALCRTIHSKGGTSMSDEYDALIPYYEDLTDEKLPEIKSEDFFDNLSFLDINDEYPM